ncbi:hypothetical protein TNCV_493231 [Trichonephila clavipes]|nr:hypothetical protein TNCV_493231 [Trichonephila clavipes]
MYCKAIGRQYVKVTDVSPAYDSSQVPLGQNVQRGLIYVKYDEPQTFYQWCCVGSSSGGVLVTVSCVKYTHAVSIDAVLTGHIGVEELKCTLNCDSFGSENAARSIEPKNVHNIFNHNSTANVIYTFRTISVDGRITTILTAVVGEDALKDDRRYSGFTVSGKRVDEMEPWRIPRLE